jgi:hypothetical protein
MEDHERRKKYFETGEGSLTPPEMDLLKGIGLTDMDTQLSKLSKQYLPEFFQALPDCQTSAAISLSAKCFMPHHIISQIIDYKATKDQLAHKTFSEKKTPSIDSRVRDDPLTRAISAKTIGQAILGELSEKTNMDESGMYEFFLLRVNPISI